MARTYQLGFFLFLAVTLFSSCKDTPGETPVPATSRYQKLQGKTMGTTYHITYQDSLQRPLQPIIDSLLKEINLEVSTYIETSVISRFNKSAEGPPIPRDGHFSRNYQLAARIYAQTKGSFDPTVMPLVNYWGFGYTDQKPVEQVDSQQVESLRDLVGFEKVWKVQDKLLKTHQGVQLDFSASAKGYGVDEIGRFLESKGIKDYLVEIGGEVRARGKNEKDKWWSIGINTPSPDAAIDDFKAIVELQDKALATSGNYRNFYELEGRKYAHTINPKTGYPELSDLLSASVFADDCATADAFATAFMVMGLDEAKSLAESLPEIEAYFIYGSVDGSMQFRFTSGVAGWLKDVAPIE